MGVVIIGGPQHDLVLVGARSIEMDSWEWNFTPIRRIMLVIVGAEQSCKIFFFHRKVNHTFLGHQLSSLDQLFNSEYSGAPTPCVLTHEVS